MHGLARPILGGTSAITLRRSPAASTARLGLGRKTVPMATIWVFGKWRDPSRRAPGSDRNPLRAELLSVEHLEERARVLAASYTVARNPRRRPRPFLSRLQENARVL